MLSYNSVRLFTDGHDIRLVALMHRREVGVLALQLESLRALPPLFVTINDMTCIGPAFLLVTRSFVEIEEKRSPPLGILTYDNFTMSLKAERRLTVLDICMAPVRLCKFC